MEGGGVNSNRTSRTSGAENGNMGKKINVVVPSKILPLKKKQTNKKNKAKTKTKTKTKTKNKKKKRKRTGKCAIMQTASKHI